MKEFRISKFIDGKLKTVSHSLTTEEYTELENSKRTLTKVLESEERYDLLIESFVELKVKMYELSIRSLIDSSWPDYVKNHNLRSKLNSLIFNVLNIGKLYLDKHFSGGDNESSFVKRITLCDISHNEVKNHRDVIHKNNHHYVLGCAIRNKAQHYSLPVRSFSQGILRQDCKVNAYFSLPITKDKLIKDWSINKVDLIQHDDIIDLHRVLDGYVKAISEMHFKARSLTKSRTEECVDQIKEWKQRLDKEYQLPNGEVDVYDKDNNKYLFNIELKWFDVVSSLQDKYPAIINFEIFDFHTYKI